MSRTIIPVEWRQALDSVATELLTQCGMTDPPIDSFRLAERLGVAVVFDESQTVRGRHKTLAGRPTVFLKPDDRDERLQWAVAHELGEVVAWRVVEKVVAAEEIAPTLREEIANQMATRILLPDCPFFADAEKVDGNLLQLKSLYRTASHALIANRLLDLAVPTVITVFDQSRISQRRSNGVGRPPGLHLVEQDCVQEIRRTSRPATMTGDGLCVQGWPVYEPEWKREILRTTFAETDAR